MVNWTESTKNVAAKSRTKANAYAHWKDPITSWEYWLLKSWQKDNSKEYSRWFMLVDGYGLDMGDAYVSEIRASINRTLNAKAAIDFDETVWESLGNFVAWCWGEV